MFMVRKELGLRAPNYALKPSLKKQGRFWILQFNVHMGKTFNFIIQSDILSAGVDVLRQNIEIKLERWSL
jgi:hypothetical protein